MAAFSPLLNVLADIPDPRRAEGKLYTLPHVLLFSILAIVSGCNSYRGIVTFIDVHRPRLNAVFGLNWRRALAHTAIRYILQGLDPAAVEAAFRRHAAQLQAARATPGKGSIALDGKTLRGSFDNFHDRAASQILSAFTTDTALVLAHMTSPRNPTRFRGRRRCWPNSALPTAPSSHSTPCTVEKTFRGRRSSQRRPDRPRQGQPADPEPADPGDRRDHGAARVRPQPRQGPQPR